MDADRNSDGNAQRYFSGTWGLFVKQASSIGKQS